MTITGPPGVGKTRLALEGASNLLGDFEHGAVWVDLAPISDPGLVPYTFARALGLWEGSSIAADRPTPALNRLQEYFQSKQPLVLLDNFEHVIAAATELGELVESCPSLKVLVTSREPLQLRWEREVPLDPLPLPDASRLPDVQTLVEYPAIALFVERARAVKPGFALHHGNARTVAEICARLDGLPLAIELAAPHLRVFSASALLERLQQRLRLLQGGLRDHPARHQTLRAAIAWSYDLLDPAEQGLFRSLAVFAGGCTLQAAAEVCGLPSETDLLDRVASLVRKALVRRAEEDDVEPRLRMLDSIREFGLEKLEESRELEAVRRRHAAYFLALAERAGPECLGPDQATWLDRLEQDHNNSRTALQWSIQSGDAETALRLAGALTWFWNVRCHWTEGRGWLEKALSVSAAPPPSAQAKALFGEGFLAAQVYDTSRAGGLLELSLALCRDLGDDQGCAEALYGLGYVAYLARDYQRAGSFFNESLTTSRRLGDDGRAAATLRMLGASALNEGKFDRAAAFLEESLVLSRLVGHVRETANALRLLGYVALVEGSLVKAGSLLTESLTLFQRVGDKRGASDDLHTLGWVTVRQGNYRRAVDLLTESLVICRDVGDEHDLVEALEGVTDLAIRYGRMEQAALLFGATQALRETLEFIPPPFFRAEIARRQGVLRSSLGDDTLAKLLMAGPGALSGDLVAGALKILHALQPLAPGTGMDSTGRIRPTLSRREREVASLVAKGLSDREIAAALFIGQRTAEFHVQSVLNKLGFRSRAQIAVWTMEQGRMAPPVTE